MKNYLGKRSKDEVVGIPCVWASRKLSALFKHTVPPLLSTHLNNLANSIMATVWCRIFVRLRYHTEEDKHNVVCGKLLSWFSYISSASLEIIANHSLRNLEDREITSLLTI